MAEQRLKCRRCRWVGTHFDLRKRPHPNHSWLADNVCPRCGSKTFNPIEETPHG